MCPWRACVRTPAHHRATVRACGHGTGHLNGAALQGRNYILPDDIKHFAVPVLAHRLIMQPDYWMARRVVEDVIMEVFNKVPVPVVKGV